MNWGKGIILTFIVFALFIFSAVYICMRQDINLVTKDYYKQELAYQSQIDRINNSQHLREKPELKFHHDTKTAELRFPGELSIDFDKGKILFFRPSNAKLDVTHEINLDSDGTQSIDLSDFKKGLWKAKISWKSGEKEYFREVVIVI
ncbi:FixH family protein [Fulvivirgaceae bacterium BMA10]|uniref:FixH family protein n=1 Tax=Splendidivirga corallicola TaxID=3051826 RepID=A0ABT8KXD2_9BACT|nr:FixH family protein [Fulvivirgaceae bacterium BMA10]